MSLVQLELQRRAAHARLLLLHLVVVPPIREGGHRGLGGPVRVRVHRGRDAGRGWGLDLLENRERGDDGHDAATRRVGVTPARTAVPDLAVVINLTRRIIRMVLKALGENCQGRLEQKEKPKKAKLINHLTASSSFPSSRNNCQGHGRHLTRGSCSALAYNQTNYG